MFDKDINVAEIMKEIRQKAQKKQQESNAFNNERFDTKVIMNPEIKAIYVELKRINEFIINKYEYTKEHETIAIKLPYSSRKPIILQKIIIIIRRCVRKISNYIWLEQNVVNQSLNVNIKALYESQMEMSKCLKIINDMISNYKNLETNFDQLQKNNFENKKEIDLIKHTVFGK